MVSSDYIWKDCPDTGRITGAYIVFYQYGPIDHFTHVPGPVSQSSAKSDYNAAFISVMSLSQFIMLNNKLLNKDPYLVTSQAPLILLGIKSAVCMTNNGKDNKHTIHISRRMNFVRNGEE